MESAGLEIIAQLPEWLRGLLYLLSAGILSLLVYLWKREQTRRDRFEEIVDHRLIEQKNEIHGRIDRIEGRVNRLEGAHFGPQRGD